MELRDQLLASVPDNRPPSLPSARLCLCAQCATSRELPYASMRPCPRPADSYSVAVTDCTDPTEIRP